jgi:hypothetical protein
MCKERTRLCLKAGKVCLLCFQENRTYFWNVPCILGWHGRCPAQDVNIFRVVIERVSECRTVSRFCSYYSLLGWLYSLLHVNVEQINSGVAALLVTGLVAGPWTYHSTYCMCMISLHVIK